MNRIYIINKPVYNSGYTATLCPSWLLLVTTSQTHRTLSQVELTEDFSEENYLRIFSSLGGNSFLSVAVCSLRKE